MQTFVLTYTTGQYDSHCAHIFAIDAPSKAAMMDELVRAALEYNKIKRDHKAEWEECNSVYRPINANGNAGDQYKIYLQRMYEFSQTHSATTFHMEVFGRSIIPLDGVSGASPEEVPLIVSVEVDVLTVDEFINECRPQFVATEK